MDNLCLSWISLCLSVQDSISLSWTAGVCHGQSVSLMKYLFGQFPCRTWKNIRDIEKIWPWDLSLSASSPSAAIDFVEPWHSPARRPGGGNSIEGTLTPRMLNQKLRLVNSLTCYTKLHLLSKLTWSKVQLAYPISHIITFLSMIY